MKLASRIFLVLFTCASLTLSAHEKKHHHSSSSSSSSSKHDSSFDHQIQLQLADSYGFAVENTQFWVKVRVERSGDKISLQLPSINFQTGQFSSDNIVAPSLPNPISGGYLYTVGGYLPQEVCPADLVYRSVVAASNNGMSPPFSFGTPVNMLPTPPTGYIVQVTNYGGIIVQQAGSFENVILPGPQILMPTEITYRHKERQTLDRNYLIHKGSTNTTLFTGPYAPVAYNLALRDTHFNDAHDGVVAYAWADNSNVKDQTQPIMNVAVSIGKVNKKGKLEKGPVKFLTDFPSGTYAWDTAVAINRTNKDNIVVSYNLIDVTQINPLDPSIGYGLPYLTVSFDGGKTWPIDGPLTVQPTGGYGNGDNRGVLADKYGNFWYMSTSLGTAEGVITDQPYFTASSDGGRTFQLVYTAPLPSEVTSANDSYDFPQYCVGGDGQGNYGIWFVTDYYTNNNLDIMPFVGFIPIYGFGEFGEGSYALLSALNNEQYLPTITASADGRVWVESWTDGGGSLISPVTLRFKSPGSLTENYAGAWNLGIGNLYFGYGLGNEISQPDFGYFGVANQGIIFDEKRQALYAAFYDKFPNFPNSGQNMAMYFKISRDNGQTWSDPIYINDSDFANRGFLSMALDSVTGNLLFGWYDGRNDKTYQSVQYYAAVIPAKKLDDLVKAIPLSYPLFVVPSAAG